MTQPPNHASLSNTASLLTYASFLNVSLPNNASLLNDVFLPKIAILPNSPYLPNNALLAAQGLDKLAASPMDKFMSGLSDMINGESKPEDGEMDSAEAPPGQAPATQDMDGFRSGLIKQTRYDAESAFLFFPRKETSQPRVAISVDQGFFHQSKHFVREQ